MSTCERFDFDRRHRRALEWAEVVDIRGVLIASARMTWRLRVKDLDFALQSLIVRSVKDGKDRRHRVAMLPQSLAVELHAKLARARLVGAADIEVGQPGSRSHMHWNGSNRGPVCHGLASGSFLKTISRPFRAVASFGATTSTTRRSTAL